MAKSVTIECDRCGEPIAGGDTAVTLQWGCILGHNGVPLDGTWYFHYQCGYSQLPRVIQEFAATPLPEVVYWTP